MMGTSGMRRLVRRFGYVRDVGRITRLSRRRVDGRMGVRVMIEVFLCDLYILSNDTSTRFVTLPRQAFISAFEIWPKYVHFFTFSTTESHDELPPGSSIHATHMRKEDRG